jgi:16S rRNA (cytidine1402-2'-O)-methyltransferase
LPVKKGRQKKLTELVSEKRTMIFYESPYRVLKTLSQFIDYFGEDRNVSVSREMTKIHAETIRGTLKEVFSFFNNKSIKGEFVIILEGMLKIKNEDFEN